MISVHQVQCSEANDQHVDFINNVCNQLNIYKYKSRPGSFWNNVLRITKLFTGSNIHSKKK